MSLRNHHSRDRRRGVPRHERGVVWGIVAVSITLLLLVGGGSVLYMKGRAASPATDPVTLCLVHAPPPEVVVVLLDVTDQLSEPQRLEIRNHLTRVRNSLQRFGLVEVYTVDRLSRRVTEPVLHLCNPGTGADLSSIYQNPTLARRKWEAFADTLAHEIDKQLTTREMPASPIFEAIQSTALRTFGRADFDGVRKRLVIFSDLLQHVPGVFTMYQHVPSFESFKTDPYFANVRADLQGVSVFIYYLARPMTTQGRAHIRFWEEYFATQGARVELVQRIFGDS